MTSPTTPITRQINQEFKGRALRAQVSFVGSLVALRMDDPEGVTSLKIFTEMTQRAGELLHAAGITTDIRSISMSYFMDGNVANWLRK